LENRRVGESESKSVGGLDRQARAAFCKGLLVIGYDDRDTVCRPVPFVSICPVPAPAPSAQISAAQPLFNATMTLPPVRQLLAEQGFLSEYPEVLHMLQAITARHAQAVGMSVEQFQRSELDRSIERVAKDRRLSAEQLLLSYLPPASDPAQ
jgi:hypothetical protein